MTDATDRALLAARKGRAALAEMQTRDAAWYGLLALDLDDTCSLAWALLAHILTEATKDPVATWTMHNALMVGLPEDEQPTLARFHRVDLWTRGLVAHTSGKAVISGAELDADDAFRPTRRLDAWLKETADAWGGPEGVLRALRRMVAALSDAWAVPIAEDALRGDVEWPKKPEYVAWCEADPVGEGPAPEAPKPTGMTEDLRILSDYWMDQEVTELGAQGELELAQERAEQWDAMRPGDLKPKVALLRVHAARGDDEAKAEVADEIAELEPATLEDREDARIALGELGLWGPQVILLGKMLEEAPAHPLILTNRGVAKLKLGDDVGAAADLEAALASQPDSAPALANLGLVRMRQEEYREARRLLEAASEVAPEEPDIYVYLAVCKSNQDEPEAAVRDLRRALELAPEHAEAARLLSELGA